MTLNGTVRDEPSRPTCSTCSPAVSSTVIGARPRCWPSMTTFAPTGLVATASVPFATAGAVVKYREDMVRVQRELASLLGG